jgi:type II secretory pathway component PulF
MHLKVLALVVAMVLSVYAIGAFFVLPGFEELFKGFGGELPFLTNMVMVTYPYWLVLPAIPAFIYVKYLTNPDLTKNAKRRILYILVSLLVFSVMFLPLLIALMYLPIFSIDSAGTANLHCQDII